MKYEIEMVTLLEAYKLGREEGRQEGAEDAQRRLVARLRRFRAERRNIHDVGGPVLDEAIERCSATVADVTPQGVG